MIKVYLSGPINSATPDGADADAHKAVFEELKAWLKQNYGHWHVVNPCEVGAKCTTKDCGEFAGHSWHCWLKSDLQAMLDCDGICLLPGWTYSAGANLEQRVAQAVNMDHFIATRIAGGWLIG